MCIGTKGWDQMIKQKKKKKNNFPFPELSREIYLQLQTRKKSGIVLWESMHPLYFLTFHISPFIVLSFKKKQPSILELLVKITSKTPAIYF